MSFFGFNSKFPLPSTATNFRDNSRSCTNLDISLGCLKDLIWGTIVLFIHLTQALKGVIRYGYLDKKNNAYFGISYEYNGKKYTIIIPQKDIISIITKSTVRNMPFLGQGVLCNGLKNCYIQKFKENSKSSGLNIIISGKMCISCCKKVSHSRIVSDTTNFGSTLRTSLSYVNQFHAQIGDLKQLTCQAVVVFKSQRYGCEFKGKIDFGYFDEKNVGYYGIKFDYIGKLSTEIVVYHDILEVIEISDVFNMPFLGQGVVCDGLKNCYIQKFQKNSGCNSINISIFSKKVKFM